MIETQLSGQLVRVIRTTMPTAVVFKHADKFTSGIPDISVTANKRTSWWEVKYARPTVETQGLQDITIKQLKTQGFCSYVIYQEYAKSRWTIIVDPIRFDRNNPDPRLTGVLEVAKGFDHQFVANYIQAVHS